MKEDRLRRFGVNILSTTKEPLAPRELRISEISLLESIIKISVEPE